MIKLQKENFFFGVLLWAYFPLSAQFSHQTGLGVSMNAPLPSQISETSTGKPIISPVFRFTTQYNLHQFSFALPSSLGIQASLMYLMKGASYGQTIEKTDTLAPVVVNGQVVGEIPTYYTGNVQGKMRLHYLDIPIQIYYQYKRLQLAVGPAVSFLLGGFDKGTATITIGDPSAQNVKKQDFNNFSNIHRIDYGAALGISYQFHKKLNFSVYSQRSLRPLYRQVSAKNPNLYHTNFLQLGITYLFQ